MALPKPVSLQLAVQGSRSKINWACNAKLEYQAPDVDMVNLLSASQKVIENISGLSFTMIVVFQTDLGR